MERKKTIVTATLDYPPRVTPKEAVTLYTGAGWILAAILIGLVLIGRVDFAFVALVGCAFGISISYWRFIARSIIQK